MRILVCAASAALALVAATPARPSFSPSVQIVGCSNSYLIGQAYLYASSRDAAVNSGWWGGVLKKWAAYPSGPWVGGDNGPLGVRPGFDLDYALFGASAVWYPLCIGAGDYASNKKAYDAFKDFVGLLRLRTSAPLYVSATIGAWPGCAIISQGQQDFVASKAVADGYALKGPDIPPASAPLPGGCHFDETLSTNVQAAAVAFLDG